MYIQFNKWPQEVSLEIILEVLAEVLGEGLFCSLKNNVHKLKKKTLHRVLYVSLHGHFLHITAATISRLIN